MKYQVVFTCKSVLRVFTETVEATDTKAAAEIVKKMVKDAGLKLNHITSIVQI